MSQSRRNDSEGGEVLSPQELGHLGGIARWHGREAVEKELEQKKEAATNLGKELGHRGGMVRWHGKDGVGSEKDHPSGNDNSYGFEPEDEESNEFSGADHNEEVDKASRGATGRKQQSFAQQKKTSSEPEGILIVQGDRILAHLSEEDLQQMLKKRYAVLHVAEPSEQENTRKRAPPEFVDDGEQQKRVRIADDIGDRSRQRSTSEHPGPTPPTPRKGASGQMSPQELGHLGGTARWYGREAAEQEKEQLNYEGAPRRRASPDADGKRSSTLRRNPRAMSPQEASHVAGIARWHGRETAEAEKQNMGYGELGRRASRSRSRGSDEGRQLSPQQLGHLGGTGRWYGREAVEKEKERMKQGGAEEESEQGRQQKKATSGGDGKQLSPDEGAHVGGTGGGYDREGVEQETQNMGYDDDSQQEASEDSPPKRSSTSGRSARAMSPEEASHLGGIARWHGRKAAEKEKKRLGYGDLGRKRSGSRSESQGGGSPQSRQHVGQLGGAGRRYGKEAIEEEKKKTGLDGSTKVQTSRGGRSGLRPSGGERDGGNRGGADGRNDQDDVMEVDEEEQHPDQDRDRGSEEAPPNDDEGDNNQMSQQERGHLGGVARWYGPEAAEREKDNMGKGNRGGGGSRQGSGDGSGGSQHATSGQGGLGELSAQELGHLGGKARWHGREAIEGELQEKRRDVDESRRAR